MPRSYENDFQPKVQDIGDLRALIHEEEIKAKKRNAAIDQRAKEVMSEAVEMVPDESESAPSPEEVARATADNSFEIGSNVIGTVPKFSACIGEACIVESEPKFFSNFSLKIQNPENYDSL